jgi:hypothetical protein
MLISSILLMPHLHRRCRCPRVRSGRVVSIVLAWARMESLGWQSIVCTAPIMWKMAKQRRCGRAVDRKEAYTIVEEGPIEPTQLTPREAFAEAAEVRACCRPGCFGSISVHRTKTTCSSFSVQTMHSDFYMAAAVPHRGLGFRRILLAPPTTSD